MRSLIDFSSWQTLLTTVISLLLASLLMVGIRLLVMQTIQRRRERENRQINERLKTLIAAYKTLGGSFTGQLQVHPLHLRDLHRRATTAAAETNGQRAASDAAEALAALQAPTDPLATSTARDAGAPSGAFASDRQRRIRDAVEAALSDVILLGTQEQVTLAARAAQDMVAGRSIETAALVVSLRHFIREALDLEPIPDMLVVPHQGPLRPAGAGGARGSQGGAAGRAGGGGGAGAGAAGGGGMGAMAMGAGAGSAVGSSGDEGTGGPDIR